MLQKLLHQFLFSVIALFPLIEPFTHSCLFYVLTKDSLKEEERKKLAIKVGMYGTVLLTGTLIIGPMFLALFGITPIDIRVAGGLVIFSLAWNMLQYDPKKEQKTKIIGDVMDQAFFPITMPLTTGAGSIATVISLGAAQTEKFPQSILGYIAIILAIATILMFITIGYHYSHTIFKTLGNSGSKVVANIAAFILLTVSISMIWGGIHSYLSTLLCHSHVHG